MRARGVNQQTPALRVALIGWGAIGQTVGRLLSAQTDASQLSGALAIEIVAVAVKDPGASRTGIPKSAQVISDPSELAALRPDIVAEAAGRASVEPWGTASLGSGASFIVSSVSAFADPDLLASMKELARSSGTQLIIQPGALGGIDALAAARLMGIEAVTHRIVKPPTAWRGTPAEQMCNLSTIEGPTKFFHGSASETANTFPKNANVAMTTALAGIGPDATAVTLIADPGASTNQHQIRAHGAFGALDVTIANNPLPGNPKSSAMAALNLARSVRNQTSSIVV